MNSEFLSILYEAFLNFLKISYPYFIIIVFINFAVFLYRVFTCPYIFTSKSKRKSKKYILSEEDIYLDDFKGLI